MDCAFFCKFMRNKERWKPDKKLFYLPNSIATAVYFIHFCKLRAIFWLFRFLHKNFYRFVFLCSRNWYSLALGRFSLNLSLAKCCNRYATLDISYVFVCCLHGFSVSLHIGVSRKCTKIRSLSTRKSGIENPLVFGLFSRKSEKPQGLHDEFI